MDSKIEYTWTTENKVFRINTVTILPDEVVDYLAKINSSFKKSPTIHVPQNLYKRNLITEKAEKYPPLLDEKGIVIPVR
tara:strand:+ start:6145 stop:6381 length:237 start_codon:yes stop_codon:yes gene_type:complete